MPKDSSIIFFGFVLRPAFVSANLLSCVCLDYDSLLLQPIYL